MDRLREEVRHLAESVEAQRQTTKRFRTNLIGLGLLFIAQLLVAGIVANAQREARDAARNAERVVRVLDDCLLAGGACYANQVEAGRQGGVRQLKFNACMFLQLPESRTKMGANECARFAYPEVPDLDLFDRGGQR